MKSTIEKKACQQSKAKEKAGDRKSKAKKLLQNSKENKNKKTKEWKDKT